MFRLKIISEITHKTLQCCAIRESEIYFRNRRHLHMLTSRNKRNLVVNNITYSTKTLSHAADAKPQTEQEYLVRLKNNPDTFGDALEKEVSDEGDAREDSHFEQQALPSQKLRTKQYADMIKSFIQKRKLKEAIDVLEVRMLKEDQVKPESYIYNLLIGACGRVGYTKKAFSLYNDMKRRGLKAMGATYTALFNACANSPWPKDGLSRAQHLRNVMIEKMDEPNETNYNAMIKAFGRCGDLPTAFSLADEMASKKIPIKDDTMNFLLQACIEDKEAGFRHALLVWRKFVEKKIPPSLYTYNLMLRCIRDCSIGDVEVMKDTLNILLKSNKAQIETNNKLLLENSNDGKLIQNSTESCMDTSKVTHGDVNTQLDPTTSENSLTTADMCRPNLMAQVPHLGNIISVSEITKPEDRLLLVGGFKGFLYNMAENNCTPDVKTFTQILDCLPGNLTAEQELFKLMKKFNVKPDIDYFNMLIKKRSMRFDYESAKDVLNDMNKYGYRPNLITFGVLSLGCRTKEEALELLNEMKEHAYRLNIEILGTMLRQACYHKNFPYVLEIMEISLKENVKPNMVFMEHLKKFKNYCKGISNDKDKKLSQSKSFQNGFRIFQMRYKTWLEEIEVDDTENVHPWTQYREATTTDTRHYKDKAQRFKARHTSRFRVKTSAKRKHK